MLPNAPIHEAYLQSLLKLELSKVRYTLIADEPFTVSHDLSTTLRGALGWSMSEVGCLHECPRSLTSLVPKYRERSKPKEHKMTERSCEVRRCPYARAFLGNEWNTQGLRVFPQSYRISGPNLTEPKTYLRGDPLTFELTLFGAGAQYSSLWTLAIIKAAARGLGGRRRGFYLAEAYDLFGSEVLYERSSALPPRTPTLSTLRSCIPSPPETWGKRGTLTLELKTPLLLRDLPPTPPLRVFVFAVMRRLHALYARFQAPIKHPLTADELTALSEAQARSDLSWREQYRQSTTTRGRVPQSGRVGSLTFSDLSNPQWCYELLSAGALIGVGQQTNMGLGRYVLRLA